MKQQNQHKYYRRLWLREKLPWFLINLGIANKGKDCSSVQSSHHWYVIDEHKLGCYYCQVELNIAEKIKDWEISYLENESKVLFKNNKTSFEVFNKNLDLAKNMGILKIANEEKEITDSNNI